MLSDMLSAAPSPARGLAHAESGNRETSVGRPAEIVRIAIHATTQQQLEPESNITIVQPLAGDTDTAPAEIEPERR